MHSELLKTPLSYRGNDVCWPSGATLILERDVSQAVSQANTSEIQTVPANWCVRGRAHQLDAASWPQWLPGTPHTKGKAKGSLCRLCIFSLTTLWWVSVPGSVWDRILSKTDFLTHFKDTGKSFDLWELAVCKWSTETSVWAEQPHSCDSPRNVKLLMPW